jgi:hypothetical protein
MLIMRGRYARMIPTPVTTCAFLASLYCSSAHSAPLATSASPLQRIEREKLCVTNGVVSALPNGSLAIDTPSSRAVLRVATTQTAEIRFRYLGPSEGSKPLASGELRRQIGLKLRAQDTCNLLYAMWHIEPDSKIAVSIKRNAGKHTHEECGAGGYLNIKPKTSVALPKVAPGESHTLRAELRGTELSLVADGKPVWEGTVGSGIAAFDGPVGFRTDNARFIFEYYAGGPTPGSDLSPPATKVNRCSPSPGD